MLDNDGEGHCNPCTFFDIKCVWAWKDCQQDPMDEGPKITYNLVEMVQLVIVK